MQVKQVYQLDKNNILTGVTEALESPLEPGIFHIPAGCIDTDISPPEVSKGEYVFWKDGGWWTGTYQDPTALPPETVARLWRDSELQRADIMLAKVQDGMPNLGTVTEWRKYRVALRTWPEQEGFPASAPRPIAPDNNQEAQ